MASKHLFVLCLVVLVAVASAEKKTTEEKYDDKYDYIDIKGILDNERIRTQYFNCFLETQPCMTPDAKFFKEKFPEAIVTKCRKCTDKQRDGFEKIVLYYTDKEPEKWSQVLTKAIGDYTKKSKKVG